jgi:hypothetical protein
MRMWMIEPYLLCRKHLLGEHNELHKFLPSFRKGIKVHGRFHPVVQIQFQGYIERHNALALEMIKRGYNHKSPLIDVPNFRLIYPQYYDMLVDVNESYYILYNKCPECRERMINALKGEINESSICKY